jgi:hypothetical protein
MPKVDSQPRTYSITLFYGAINTVELKGPIAWETTGAPKFPTPINCVV